MTTPEPLKLAIDLARIFVESDDVDWRTRDDRIAALAPLVDARVRPLAEALWRYAQHKDNCNFMRFSGECCSCGLVAALKAAGES